MFPANGTTVEFTPQKSSGSHASLDTGGKSWNLALSILVDSIVSPLSLVQTPNLWAHRIPLATSPPVRLEVSLKDTSLSVAAFVVLIARISSPMSGPRLAVG